MLISNPTREQWKELGRYFREHPEDFAHMDQFLYRDVRAQDANQRIQFLQRSAGFECWLVSDGDQIIGFVTYGEVIPGHQNAFGLAIGRQFESQGYETQALRELICILSCRRVPEVNGFCHPENTAIIRVMKRLGFQEDTAYHDPGGANAVKFVKRLCDNRPSRTENEMPATAHAAGNAIAPPARLASRGLAGQALEAGQQRVMSVCELRKLVCRTVSDNLGKEYANMSGAVMYNGWSSLRPGPLYLMGLNPGGNPEEIKETVLESICALQENHCAYTDECWSHLECPQEPCPCRGESPHQRRVRDLVGALDRCLDLRNVFAANAIFLRSKDTQELKNRNPDNKLWERCWRVHKFFLKIVRPKLILCLGNGNGLSPFSLLREQLLREQCSEASEVCRTRVAQQEKSGKRGGSGETRTNRPLYWKSFVSQVLVNGSEKLHCMVVGVPHPSRCEIIPSRHEITDELEECLRAMRTVIRGGGVLFG
jgi:RimJ/RimL family protein N-acetyltransferase